MPAHGSSARQTRRFNITGRVQGVFFRASTKRVADSLNLFGHAINLADGSVEVLACGDAAAIESLQSWLQQGPPMASVSAVIDQGEAADVETCGNSFTTG